MAIIVDPKLYQSLHRAIIQDPWDIIMKEFEKVINNIK